MNPWVAHSVLGHKQSGLGVYVQANTGYEEVFDAYDAQLVKAQAQLQEAATANTALVSCLAEAELTLARDPLELAAETRPGRETK